MRLLLAALFSCLLLNTQLWAEPVKFAVTDIVGLEELQREFAAFEQKLSEASGLQIKLFPVTSRTAVVEALRAKNLDLVLTGPAEYVIIKKRVGATPLVALVRPDYFSAIVVLRESGITSIQELVGRKVAFGDFGSTSYHLAPLQLIKDAGLNPKQDIKAINISKHVGWDSLKRKNVDALGLKHDQYQIFRSKESEPSRFRVIARGPDLPNDLLLAGSHVSAEIKQKIKNTFANQGTELMQAMLKGIRNKKYKTMRFVADVTDTDYNYVRKLYVTLGYPEFAESVG